MNDYFAEAERESFRKYRRRAWLQFAVGMAIAGAILAVGIAMNA